MSKRCGEEKGFNQGQNKSRCIEGSNSINDATTTNQQSGTSQVPNFQNVTASVPVIALTNVLTQKNDYGRRLLAHALKALNKNTGTIAKTKYNEKLLLKKDRQGAVSTCLVIHRTEGKCVEIGLHWLKTTPRPGGNWSGNGELIDSNDKVAIERKLETFVQKIQEEILKTKEECGDVIIMCRTESKINIAGFFAEKGMHVLSIDHLHINWIAKSIHKTDMTGIWWTSKQKEFEEYKINANVIKKLCSEREYAKHSLGVFKSIPDPSTLSESSIVPLKVVIKIAEEASKK